MTGWHQFREDWLNKWAMCIRAKKKLIKPATKERIDQTSKKKKCQRRKTEDSAEEQFCEQTTGRLIRRTKSEQTNERTQEWTDVQANERMKERTNERANDETNERANERANLAGGGGGGGRRCTVEKAYKWIEKASVQVANKLNEPLTLLTTSQPSEWVTHETTEVRKLLKTEKNVVGWVEIQTNQIEK